MSCKFFSKRVELGIPMGPKKKVGPSFVLSFAGIELDTQNMEAQLPSD